MIQFTKVTWYSQLLAIVLGVCIFAFGIYIGMQMGTHRYEYVEKANDGRDMQKKETHKETKKEMAPVSRFQWKHSLLEEEGEYPKSDVTLVVTREDGTVEDIAVAKVEGSCNVLTDAEVYSKGSSALLCWYAGFGYQFRVIDVDGGFEIQQKEIEEASPDYNPPLAEFITILKL